MEGKRVENGDSWRNRFTVGTMQPALRLTLLAHLVSVRVCVLPLSVRLFPFPFPHVSVSH